MLRRQKFSDAVSPVIATILLVVITVILAGMLYVMVIGFGTGGVKPVVGVKDTGKIGEWIYRIIYAVSPGNKPLADFKIMLENTTADSTIYGLRTIRNGTLGFGAPANNPITMNFTDIAGEGKFNDGDHITLTFANAPQPGTKYTIRLVWSADMSELVSTDIII